MRSSLTWSLAAVVGVAVAAGTYWAAGWHVGAVGVGLLYLIGWGLLLRVHSDLRSRVDAWNDMRASLWSAAFGGLVAFAVGILNGVLGLSPGEFAAVGLVVFGAGTAGFAAGIGMTLAYVDRAADEETADSEAVRT